MRSVLPGHFRYYGVHLNGQALGAFRKAVGYVWRTVLRRRGVSNCKSRFGHQHLHPRRRSRTHDVFPTNFHPVEPPCMPTESRKRTQAGFDPHKRTGLLSIAVLRLRHVAAILTCTHRVCRLSRGRDPQLACVASGTEALAPAIWPLELMNSARVAGNWKRDTTTTLMLVSGVAGCTYYGFPLLCEHEHYTFYR